MSGSSAGRRKGDHIATPPVLHGWACPVGPVVPRTEVMYLVLKGCAYKAWVKLSPGGQRRRPRPPALLAGIDAAFDVAFQEIFVVLLAGVLHDLPIRPQREG